MSFNLQTHFGGLCLNSPVIVGACPMSLSEQTRISMEVAGVGAIVLPSLFEEQVIRWSASNGAPITEREKQIFSQADQTQHHWAVPDATAYLSLVNRASSQHSVPIIASVNGFTAGGWMDFAGELQEAGASAIELNIHHSRYRDDRDSNEIEAAILDAVRDINAAITVPLFVKLGRNFTSLPSMARRLLSGAQGLVLHGRAPTLDICLDSLKVVSRWKLTSGDGPGETLDALMHVHSCCPAMSLACCGGIANADHLIKSLLAGADVGMVTSAIYQEGPDVIRFMLDGLTKFMESHRMQSLRELQLQRPLQFNSDEERAAYIDGLTAHLDASDIQANSPTIQGDRWGHVEH